MNSTFFQFSEVLGYTGRIISGVTVAMRVMLVLADSLVTSSGRSVIFSINTIIYWIKVSQENYDFFKIKSLCVTQIKEDGVLEEMSSKFPAGSVGS